MELVKLVCRSWGVDFLNLVALLKRYPVEVNSNMLRLMLDPVFYKSRVARFHHFMVDKV